MVLFHIGGGGASRAPDISRLSLCNTTAGQRSVFFLRSFGCCSILPSSKTENLIGGMKSPIPRLYEQRLSTLVCQYVLLFRKVHCYFSSLLFGGSSVRTAFQEQFLIHRGRKTNGPWNRIVFSKLIFQVTGKHMKFSGYRHYSNWAATKLVLPNASEHLKTLVDDPKNTFRNWSSHSNVVQLALLPVQESLMRQSGHSPQTALNSYSVDPGSHKDVSYFQMELFFSASKLWHVVLKNQIRPKILSMISKSTLSGIFSPPFDIKHSCGGGCNQSILKNVFGFDSFNSKFQEDCIANIRNEPQKSFLFVAPTGSGMICKYSQ